MQIADAPGRNEPGTGKLDIDRYLDRIAATGYDGWVGLEYKPSGASADAFDWLPRERRVGPLNRTTVPDDEKGASDMTTVAFIGLGIMGGPMAANLVKAGFEVVGYNRSPEKVAARSSTPAAAVPTGVAEAVRDADVVITMVPDSPDVEAVTGGDDGVFANAAGRARSTST